MAPFPPCCRPQTSLVKRKLGVQAATDISRSGIPPCTTAQALSLSLNCSLFINLDHLFLSFILQFPKNITNLLPPPALQFAIDAIVPTSPQYQLMPYRPSRKSYSFAGYLRLDRLDWTELDNLLQPSTVASFGRDHDSSCLIPLPTRDRPVPISIQTSANSAHLPARKTFPIDRDRDAQQHRNMIAGQAHW